MVIVLGIVFLIVLVLVRLILISIGILVVVVVCIGWVKVFDWCRLLWIFVYFSNLFWLMSC